MIRGKACRTIIGCLFAFTDLLFAGSVHHDSSDQSWTLKSGPVTYQLAERHDQLVLEYFGPTLDARVWNRTTLHGDFGGLADGESLASGSLRLTSQESHSIAPGVEELLLRLKHTHLPLEIEARYTAWGETGVFTRELRLINRGEKPIHVASAPSLSWDLPQGDYTLRYLWGGSERERQSAVEKLGVGIRAFGSAKGGSSNGYAPWLSLHDGDSGVEYLVELAWSGNWQADVEMPPPSAESSSQDVRVDMGIHFDFGGALRLAPGETFVLPKVEFTASGGDLDDAANQMHRYQREYVFPQSSANRPPLIQFNSWYAWRDKLDVEDLKRSADVAASMGVEVFVLDAGWYGHKDWSKELGDYEPDPKEFPYGLEEFANYVRSRGMKFGLWTEIEDIGPESQLFREHSDWCLSYNGQPISDSGRCQLNFARPEVREWARATIDRLVRKYHIEWIKIDYNIAVGDRFDPPGMERTGDILYQHVSHYYKFLDEIRAAYPNLIIENCASGGLRFDSGILAHVHTNWLSDDVDPISSLQLGYSCTLEFSPEVCNHWMVGDKDNGEINLTNPAGWWDFMFRVPMNGQLGLSSRVGDWNQALKDHATENLTLYKRIRGTLTGADVYHLTPAPKHTHPTGWMAIQYVGPNGTHSVVTAYRLADGPAKKLFRLRGLLPDAIYEVSKDGKPLLKARGVELASSGLRVSLDEEWRAAIFEIDVRP
ncbi:MAG: alpha-galactosidase [Terriglobales bacterium]